MQLPAKLILNIDKPMSRSSRFYFIFNQSSLRFLAKFKDSNQYISSMPLADTVLSILNSFDQLR